MKFMDDDDDDDDKNGLQRHFNFRINFSFKPKFSLKV